MAERAEQDNAARQDAALVESARAGDYAAFEQLADRHAPALYGLAMRMLRRREDAEDIVQTALLKAMEHLNDFRGDAPFGAWLRRIAVNAALSLMRKRRGLPMATATGGGDEEALPMPERVADWRSDVTAEVDRRETRALLEQAIAELDEKYRLVFLLRDIEQLSVKETAEQLGLTESNVKVRLMRARLMLRERLTEIFGEGPNLKHDHAEHA